MPSIIYIGLIGNKDIKIATEDGVNEAYLFGDYARYAGTITVPNNVNVVYTRKYSTVKVVKENGSKPEIAEIPENFKPEDHKQPIDEIDGIDEIDENDDEPEDTVVPEK